MTDWIVEVPDRSMLQEDATHDFELKLWSAFKYLSFLY